MLLELAKKYDKQVLFSGIGVERYDEGNKRCQRLKAALNLGCVRQITTRDGIDRLEKYREHEENFAIAKVSDPAVFAARVFERFYKPEQNPEKKTIGIFVLRANGFTDNKYDFTKEQSAKLWVALIKLLKEKGYNYKLMTSGHFGDEAFMDCMIRDYGVDIDRCVFNINTPEKLVEKLGGCSGVIACRMHPSIISFSLGIPSVGIVWNQKVQDFYDSVGYPDRTVRVEELTAEHLVEKIEQAMTEGVYQDKDYMMTVYQTLYAGICNALGLQETANPTYTYEELMENLTPFGGTSEKEQFYKLRRKFRRAYRLLNKRYDALEEKNQKIKELEAELAALKAKQNG